MSVGGLDAQVCPFEPHRLPRDEMEYTTMPQLMKKLEGRWGKF